MLRLCNGRRFIGARNKAITSILLDTGMREGELIGLDLNNIEFNRGVMKVKGKGSKERVAKNE